MQGGATQAIRGYRRGAPTQQMPPAPPEPYARDLLYFHHGLLGVLRLKIEQHYLLPEDATRLKMSGSSNSSSLLP